MNPKINRRSFIIKTSCAGLTGCALLSGSNLFALNNLFSDDDIPDPRELCYCGYKCPSDCKFLKASVENNTELKKEAYDEWKIKERYNVDFDPEKIYCFKCKPGDNPEGVVLTNCTVRSCAIEKEIDCCIECDELDECNKDLWERFPKFKEMVIQMRKKYLTSLEDA